MIRESVADWVPRTEIEREADRLDCNLYRIICQLEQIYDREESTRPKLGIVLHHLRMARPNLRWLMSEKDRKGTA